MIDMFNIEIKRHSCLNSKLRKIVALDYPTKDNVEQYIFHNKVNVYSDRCNQNSDFISKLNSQFCFQHTTSNK